MSTNLEGWPYKDETVHKPTKLEAKYVRAVDHLRRADVRMRRAFHAWEKARAAVQRLERVLDSTLEGKAVPPCRVVGDPELDDKLEGV